MTLPSDGRERWPWLVAAPIAHRGLHDRHQGIVENSLAAFAAAADHGFAIECDVRAAADGGVVVFHDDALERLTGRVGRVADLPAREVTTLRLLGSDEQVPRLEDVLALIEGRVPIVCEIKSAFDRDTRLADRVVELVRDYDGPLAFKSFDPDIIAHLRRRGGARPLGIVSEASFVEPEWGALAPDQRARMASLAHFAETRPDFLSFAVDDLPHAAAALCRSPLGLPVMTWTVRTAEQRRRAHVFADQMVFEGFLP